nr:hypothetical protein [Nannocystis pusilla]
MSCSNWGTYWYPSATSLATIGGASSSERSPGIMSMMGFAARPGTAVLPTCSMATKASRPQATNIASRAASNFATHPGS